MFGMDSEVSFTTVCQCVYVRGKIIGLLENKNAASPLLNFITTTR